MKICSALALGLIAALSVSLQANAAPQNEPKLGDLLGDFSYAMGVRDAVCRMGATCFKNGAVALMDNEGVVVDITLYWTPSAAPSSANESRNRAKPFLPADAKLTKTGSTPTTAIVDYYHSASLAKKLPAVTVLTNIDGTSAGTLNTWGRAKPGTFMVIHVPRYKTIVGIGDNP